jgi:hypothetical protein
VSWNGGFRERLMQFEAQRTLAERERERIAFLNGPPPKNERRLLEPVKGRVVKPFCVRGTRLEPGAIVELPRFDARSLAAAGRLELLD